jgi:Na+-transporting methylmalonyl-CoA/oxaloacetate decarboxylase gamma subunit
MIGVLVGDISLGMCIVFILISLLLLAKFVKEGVVVALTPLYVEEEEDEEDSAYATEAMQSVEP